MSLRACPAAVALFILLASPLATAEPFALATAFDQIYRVDLATREAVVVGDIGSVGSQQILVQGMAYAPNGRLLAASDNTKSLIRFDFLGERATTVGSLGLAGQGDPTHNDALDLSFAVTCDGSAWLASAVRKELWRVDPATGATTLIGSTGAKITGLAARGRDLLGAGAHGNETLYRIDTATGQATPIGNYAASVGNATSVAPTFDASGKLWAVLSSVPPADGVTPVKWTELATIDPVTGAMTRLGPITGPPDLENTGIRGFAIAPQATCQTGGTTAIAIPASSPFTLALLGLLLAIGAWCGLRLRGAR